MDFVASGIYKTGQFSLVKYLRVIRHQGGLVSCINKIFNKIEHFMGTNIPPMKYIRMYFQQLLRAPRTARFVFNPFWVDFCVQCKIRQASGLSWQRALLLGGGVTRVKWNCSCHLHCVYSQIHSPSVHWNFSVRILNYRCTLIQDWLSEFMFWGGGWRDYSRKLLFCPLADILLEKNYNKSLTYISHQF